MAQYGVLGISNEVNRQINQSNQLINIIASDQSTDQSNRIESIKSYQINLLIKSNKSINSYQINYSIKSYQMRFNRSIKSNQINQSIKSYQINQSIDRSAQVTQPLPANTQRPANYKIEMLPYIEEHDIYYDEYSYYFTGSGDG